MMAIVALFWSTVVAAAPLNLATVLAAVDGRVPELAVAEAKRAEQEAKRLSAAGAFDPTLLGKYDQELSGPYPRASVDSALVMATPFGPELEAGYRWGGGSFPDYYGQYETLPMGEVRVGVSVPLLQDLGITAERAKLLVARHGVEGATAAMDAKRQAMLGKAASAWWKWVATGQKLAVAEQQLQLAEDRAAGLRRQVALGAKPELAELDNQQVVLERRANVVDAQQQLLQAALMLSLYYRGEDMQPVVPRPSDLPEALPRPVLGNAQPEDVVQQALARRPELRVADALLAGAQVDLGRARSTVLPKLNSRIGVAKDLGPESASSKASKAEVDLGLKLEVPLALRKGRGELARSRAAVERLQAERRGLADAVRADVLGAHAQHRAAVQAWAVRQESAEQAATVAAMERTAFSLGSSDVFRLTKREETLAKARKAEIEALLAAGLGEATLRTVSGGW